MPALATAASAGHVADGLHGHDYQFVDRRQIFPSQPQPTSSASLAIYLRAVSDAIEYAV